MLAATWVLLLMPFIDAVKDFGWASKVTIPNVFHFPGALTLDDTLFCWSGVSPLVFCIGVVLLFSKERGRRRSQFDWTRRWGVLCSYLVLLLSAVQFFFIAALVMAGIAAIFVAIPAKYQPHTTQFFVNVSTTYIRYAPHPSYHTQAILVVVSSITVLLACAPLFNALSSTGPRRLALAILAPLAFFSVIHLAQIVHSYIVGPSRALPAAINNSVYFYSDLLIGQFAGRPAPLSLSGLEFGAFVVEATKWCVILAVAVWLSIAQLAAWRRRIIEKHPPPSRNPK